MTKIKIPDTDTCVKITEEVQTRLTADARAKFLLFVQEEEKCDLDTARAICLGQTDPIIYEYTLGWKISDPILQKGMWGKTTSKLVRKKWIQHFRETLTPEEDALFVEGYLSKKVSKRFQEELERAEKRKKLEEETHED